jgi:hypothetical protein
MKGKPPRQTIIRRKRMAKNNECGLQSMQSEEYVLKMERKFKERLKQREKLVRGGKETGG